MKTGTAISIAIMAALLVVAGAASAQNTFSGALNIDAATWLHEKTVGSSTVSERFGKIARYAHTDGTNDSQMTDIVVISGTLTNGASATFALASMTNSFGDVVSFATVKTLIVTASNSTLSVGNASADPFSSWLGDTNHTVNVASGGMLALVAPLSGFVSTNSNLKILNTTTNTATYYLYIGGIQ